MPAWLIPAIIAAVGTGAQLLQQRAAGKPQQEQARLYNEWLANRQTGVNDILDKLAAAGYNPFGPQTSTSSGSSSSNTVSNMSSTTKSSQKPVVTPDYKKLEGMFRTALEGRMARPSHLPVGYAERGARDINSAYAGTTAAARNIAARRGLSAEQTFGLASPIEASRAGKIADFLVDMPLKDRQLQTEDINLAAQVAQIFGLGSEGQSSTTGRTTSNTTGSSSNMMTSPPNIGALAALLLPPGPQMGSASGNSAGATIGSGLSGLLTFLYTHGMMGDYSQPGVNSPIH